MKRDTDAPAGPLGRVPLEPAGAVGPDHGPVPEGYAQAVAGLREALTRPTTERAVADFVAAAGQRFEGRFTGERAARRIPYLLDPAAGLAAAALLLLALWPRPTAPPLAPEAPSRAERTERTERTTAAAPAAAARRPHPEPAAPAPAAVAPTPVAAAPSAAAPRLTVVSQRDAHTDGDVALSTAERRPVTVRTGPAGALTFADPQTATVAVAGGSVVEVAAWTEDAAILRLERGQVRSAVLHRASGQRYEVVTPYARVRVVGTDFAVQHIPGEATLVEGFAGRVAIETLDGRTLGFVGPGESLRIAPPRVLATADGAAPADIEAGAAAAAELPGDGDPAGRAADSGEVRTPAAHASGRPFRATAVGRGFGAAAAGESAAHAVTVGAPEASAPAASAPEAASPSPATLLGAARQLIAQGSDVEAIRLLEESAGRSWRVRALLADAYLVAGKRAEARAAYEAALATAGEPPPAALLVDLARLLDAPDGDPRAARETYARYLQHYPSGPAAPAALWAIARVEHSAGRSAAAEASLQRLVTDHAATAEGARALARLGRERLAARDWDGAEALFSGAQRSSHPPTAETALVGLVRVHLGRGDLPAARQTLAELERRFPSGSRTAEVQRLRAALPPEP